MSFGFRVEACGAEDGVGQGAWCRVQGAGCRVHGAGYRVQGAGCRVQGAGYRVQGAGCRVQACGAEDGVVAAVRVVREANYPPPRRLPRRGYRGTSLVRKRPPP